ncbi:hypothetical protein TRFO_26670 [Tritrichomonas foetus]|uniref:Vps16 N-terminal domain-containing protein n=1 Tax=Tritrichomonas foetus TaxID=1144522 RepID=A0A1J4K735_9EUKA|nr:hypothetical protein TRFO_26670 [Tritrichomonas foetus]|eukprot:OHT05534.1 hypothetical protein TRFO_26670 [Tritrichomonas foetus]
MEKDYIDLSIIDEFKASFAQTLTKSRTLGNTTFAIEYIHNDLDVSDEYLENIDYIKDTYSFAQYGGAIAVLHDKFKNQEGYFTHLHIYNGNGRILCKIPLDYNSRIRSLFITPEECVLLIYADGIMRVYNLRGALLIQNDISQDISHTQQDEQNNEQKNEPNTDNNTDTDVNQSSNSCRKLLFINEIIFWPHGFFAILNGGIIYIVDDFLTLQPKLFAKYEGSALLGGYAKPADPILGYDHLLYAYDTDGRIILIQRGEEPIIQDFEYQVSNILFSPSYTYALVQCDSNYFFFDANLENILFCATFDDIHPRKIVWCGNDTILLIRGSSLYMIGATDSVLHWDIDESFAIVTEVDGARLLSKTSVFLLRAVPDSALSFAVWDTKSQALKLFTKVLDDEELALTDVSALFSQEEFDSGIRGCLEAASFYMNSKQKYYLMKAVARALVHLSNNIKMKTFDKYHDNDDFENYNDEISEHLSVLRVCEQMFHPPYNMPITYTQFKSMSSAMLLKRLCNRSLHKQAYEIANFLRVDTEFISAHWGNCMVRSNNISKELAIKRIEMMDQPLDFIDLASTAFEVNKNELAISLLEINPAKARGVPLLLKRGHWDEALQASIDSCDVSLMLYAFESAFKENKEALIRVLDKNYSARFIWEKMSTGDEKMRMKQLNNTMPSEIVKQVINANYERFDEAKKKLKNEQDGIYSYILNLYHQLQPVREFLRKSTKSKRPENKKRKLFSFGKKKEEESKENENKDNPQTMNEENDASPLNNVENIDYDKLTPVEIFDQVCLTNDKDMIKNVSSLLGFSTEHTMWRHFQIAVKTNNFEVIKTILSIYPSKLIVELVRYSRENDLNDIYEILTQTNKTKK